MPKRITIVLDELVIKKLRLIQAKKIQQTQKTYSFSRVVNDALKNAL